MPACIGILGFKEVRGSHFWFYLLILGSCAWGMVVKNSCSLLLAQWNLVFNQEWESTRLHHHALLGTHWLSQCGFRTTTYVHYFAGSLLQEVVRALMAGLAASLPVIFVFLFIFRHTSKDWFARTWYILTHWIFWDFCSRAVLSKLIWWRDKVTGIIHCSDNIFRTFFLGWKILEWSSCLFECSLFINRTYHRWNNVLLRYVFIGN